MWKVGRKVGEGGVEIQKDRFDGEWKGVCDILAPEMENGRARITDWIEEKPNSILKAGT